ncbi:DUF3102 domain-containing protein [Virgibacillus necropolis]|uniref:J domain-containing protein n=1 Tax=Virgibacillus necropolis TaxID=163877 RepID=A0A221MGV3_9BACI|nr:DUF3102 domain-containing protein [Virgibacillus necropolis]ASN06850.1 hypothetical protein CFK40_18395 [Virgibacillus necropolis]
MEKLTDRVNLDDARRELKEWQQIEAGATFQIGRILKEVKDTDIQHGQWTEWLESVGYNPRTAQRYMQIYKRFNGVEGAENVPVSKLTELLSLPEELDVKPFLIDAKTDTKKVIREKVRHAKGAPERQKESRRPETQIEQPKKPKQATKVPHESAYINKVTAALNNLIPEFATELEEGDASISEILAIGSESHEIQRKLLVLSEIDVEIEVKHKIMIAKLTPDKKLKYIKGLVGVVVSTAKILGWEFNWKELETYYENNDYESMKADFEESQQKADEELKNRREQGNTGGGGNNFDWSSLFGRGVSSSKILGVPDNATKQEAKDRYRQLMKLLHPDHGGDAQLFDVVKKAYDGLTGKSAS